MTICNREDRDYRFKAHLWISTLIHLVRSRSLVYAFALSALGTYLIATGGKIPDFSIPLRLIISSYLVALATYLYNDITDYHTDTVNNRNSIYTLESIKQKITKYYTVTFFVIATILAFSINFSTGVTSLVFSGLAITYSHPKIQLKNMFVVKTAVTGGGAFLTSMMGGLSSGMFSHLGIMASLIAFCFYFMLGPLGDIGDLKGDREAGRRTFPVVIGVKKSFFLMAAAALSILSIFLISNILLGMNIVGVGLGILVVMFMLLKISKASKNHSDKLELKHCRNSIRYCLFACQISLLLGTTLIGIM